MESPVRNSGNGFARLWLIAILGGIVAIVTALIIHWQPARTVKRQQAALIEAIESRNAARIRRLMSARYQDRWEMTPDDVVEAVLELRRQFLVLELTPEEATFEISGGRGTASMRFTVRGTPIGPGGNTIIRKINQLESPFRFTWEKEQFLPSSWRLLSIDHPAILDDLRQFRSP